MQHRGHDAGGAIGRRGHHAAAGSVLFVHRQRILPAVEGESASRDPVGAASDQRTKEIGIRKVSGASVWNILVLISRGYTKLIILAFLIGAPVSYWMMSGWLEDFAYHEKPSPWIFLVTGVSTLVIAVLITGYHSVKAALTNPVDVLKDE